MWTSQTFLNIVTKYRASSSSDPPNEYDQYINDPHYVVGEGGFGIVYRCNKHIAVKKGKLFKEGQEDHSKKLNINEAHILRKLENIQHQNILQVLHFKIPDDNRYMDSVYEFLHCSGIINTHDSMNLHMYIHKFDKYPEESENDFRQRKREERKKRIGYAIKHKFFNQLYNGISHLHKYNIYHLDIKPGNICLHGNIRTGITLKIIDFGLAHSHESNKKVPKLGSRGTHGYMPKIPDELPDDLETANTLPELSTPIPLEKWSDKSRTASYLKMADLWAMVIVFHEILLGKIIWTTVDDPFFIKFLDRKKDHDKFNEYTDHIDHINYVFSGFRMDELLERTLFTMCNDDGYLTTENDNYEQWITDFTQVILPTYADSIKLIWGG